VNEAKEKDHEVSMAQSQLKKSEKNIAILRKKLGKKERNIPAWVQAKITDTEHNTDAAAGYMDEARKSGDYSLRDWFSKSRSSDGTPGWVQLGGKYAGKPCAKQPGQKTKPKCGSSKMKADLSDKEEEYAFRSKNRKDKNPNRKGAPINVATEKKRKLKDSYSNWRAELEDLHEIPALVAAPLAIGGVALAGRAIGGALNKFVDSQKKGQHRITAKQGNPVAGLNASRRRIENSNRNINQSFELEGEMVDEGLPLALGAGAALLAAPYLAKRFLKPKADKALQRGRNELHLKGNPIGAGARGLDKQSFELEGDLVEEGKKDACYHKVKSRYKVWPSAYASGALVKCRKVGAKNWGNKTKKEGYEFSNWREEMLLEGLEDKLRKMSPEQIEDLIKANKGAEEKIRAALKSMRTPKSQGPGAQMPPNFAKQGVSSKPRASTSNQKRTQVNVADYASRNTPGSVWQKAQQNPSAYRSGPGVKSDFSGVKSTPRSRGVRPTPRPRGVRPKMRGGKLGLALTAAGLAAPFVVGAIKKAFNKESYEFSNWRDDFQAMEFESVDIIKAEPLQSTESIIDEKAQKCWKGYEKKGTKKMFGKTYNNCVKKEEVELQEKKSKKDACKGKPKRWQDSDCDGKWYEKGEDVKEDWQKSNRKDGVDGMSQSSVNAYKRENPGSKLQTAVTEKNPKGKRAKRRKSFCDRSDGQRKMHNIDCSKTPEKKICKARKRWRC